MINSKKEIVDKIVSDIKNMDLYEISKMPIGKDEAHLIKADIVRLPNTFEGLGTTFGNTKEEKKNASLIKKLEEKNKITNKILSEFGSNFFFVELKIPKDKYYHFIEYCEFKNIIELYKNKETLKVIQILKKESVKYLEILKEK